jgi:hypothetical protein
LPFRVRVILAKTLRCVSFSAAHQLPTDKRNTSVDTDLSLVNERWADLPEVIRVGIMAMVRASRVD